MRKAVFTLGAPGSGKSHFISYMGWDGWSISTDELRMILSPPELGETGKFQIKQSLSGEAWKKSIETMETRMKKGEFIVFDSTLPKQHIQEFYSLCKENDYEMLIVDFTDIPFEKLIKNNASRPEYKRVPESVIERIHQEQTDENVTKLISKLGIKTIKIPTEYYTNDDSLKNEIESILNPEIMDFSKYEQIVLIGDLQGCFTVLNENIIKDGLDDKKCYIFVGDLFDRGIENAKVAKWFVDEAVHKENVYITRGNHEEHPLKWIRGEEAVSDEFEKRTLPELLDAGFTKEDIKKITSKMVDVLQYKYHDIYVQVCHGGLSCVPNDIYKVSTSQFTKGSGFYTSPVDEQFTNHAPSNWFQVHGHRNQFGNAINKELRSYTLEDQVEYGGFLRVAYQDKNGFTFGEYRNSVFPEWRSRLPRHYKKEFVGPWMTEEPDTSIPTDLYEKMKTHEGVNIIPLKKTPHISSINFTKDVFFKQSWDDVVIKARGLFVNNQSNEIVSRGYEKFFNVDERPETSLENLGKFLSYPVKGYLKENGFLGNIGYDKDTDSLFIASKSSNSGSFCEWFTEIFNQTFDERAKDKLKRWLRDQEACAVFEVIDPLNDPHMIDYDSKKIVLLDVFHRSLTGKKFSYSELKKIGEKWGVEVKERIIEFKNHAALSGWLKSATKNMEWRHEGRDIEGLVLEGMNGEQTKIKLPHYAFWKRMRSASIRMAKIKSQCPDINPEDLLSEQRESELKKEIEEMRDILKKFGGQGNASQEAKEKIKQNLFLIKKSDTVKETDSSTFDDEKNKKLIENIVSEDKHPLAISYLTWLSKQPNSVHKRILNRGNLDEENGWLDILKLRKMYYSSGEYNPSWLSQKWVDFRFHDEDEEQDNIEEKLSKEKIQPPSIKI